MNYEVVRINPSKIIIQHKVGGLYGFTLAIPLKYLVKVDAEAKKANVKIGSDKWVDKTVWNYKNHKKGVIRRMTDGVAEVFTEDGKLQTWQIEDLVDEYDGPIEKWKCPEPAAPKIKVGDRVKFKNIYELQKVKNESFRWMLVMFASKEATITAVEDNGFYRVDIDPSIGGINDDMIECKVEPTEQTEAEKKPNVGSIKIPVEVDLTDSYWDAYAANLAKEIVLKTVNSALGQRSMSIAEYAVSVAKAVVDGLKTK